MSGGHQVVAGRSGVREIQHDAFEIHARRDFVELQLSLSARHRGECVVFRTSTRFSSDTTSRFFPSTPRVAQSKHALRRRVERVRFQRPIGQRIAPVQRRRTGVRQDWKPTVLSPRPEQNHQERKSDRKDRVVRRRYDLENIILNDRACRRSRLRGVIDVTWDSSCVSRRRERQSKPGHSVVSKFVPAIPQLRGRPIATETPALDGRDDLPRNAQDRRGRRSGHYLRSFFADSFGWAERKTPANRTIPMSYTYNMILGEQYVKDYGLNRETNYDPTIAVSVSQEMTSGAYRLLHNIIPAQYKYVGKNKSNIYRFATIIGTIRNLRSCKIALFNIRYLWCWKCLSYMSTNYTVYETEEPSKLFLKPDSLLGNFDGILRGLMETPGREPQSSYNDLVTIHIY